MAVEGVYNRIRSHGLCQWARSSQVKSSTYLILNLVWLWFLKFELISTVLNERLRIVNDKAWIYLSIVGGMEISFNFNFVHNHYTLTHLISIFSLKALFDPCLLYENSMEIFRTLKNLNELIWTHVVYWRNNQNKDGFYYTLGGRFSYLPD